ncbi:hypothetical protein SELMODRAFT_404782 [Selaginella moellendorffii]|uniref:Calponin-homology (CH) domain-containing protein n=1 Tax=Selaginella moellendorffii TaxID=88036 RepID=D8QXC1_SELML|nr:hypothetical protein SELMODRAFT_404782 [Selaginella moellendorffii]
MRGFPALRRDVLRWLITLNLSQPIKNVRRDFSNGFLVAEIFSQYYPQDIQMHSFDNGTRLAKKKDNWAQLENFFRKKEVPVIPGEIENIVNCGPEDGIGPLLERMYWFLARKNCKPQEPHVQDLWTGVLDNPEASLIPNTQSITRVIDNSVSEDDSFFNELHCSISYSQPHMTELPLGCNFSSDTDVIDKCLPHKMYEEQDSFRKQHDSINSDSQAPSSGRKKSSLNAVERARQKEIKEMSKRSAKTGKQFPPAQDPRLAFRSPNRQRQFKSYTLMDYKRQQALGYVVLGKLGPDSTDELRSKRETLERMKEFGRSARSIVANQSREPRKPKVKPPSTRAKALKFASTVPKPKAKETDRNHLTVGQRPTLHPLTELEILEAKYQSDKQHLEDVLAPMGECYRKCRKRNFFCSCLAVQSAIILRKELMHYAEKKEFGLDKLRAEYHRFQNEIDSIRTPNFSQNAAATDSDSCNEKQSVWDSIGCLEETKQELSKSTVKAWDCFPESKVPTDCKSNVEAGDSSKASPRVRITATTLFTANQGQVFVEECRNEDVISDIPRVTLPPSKSPREPMPRSDGNSSSSVRFPAGEMVLASSSMNVHIKDTGVSSPEKIVDYPTESLKKAGRQYIKPVTRKRLTGKIKNILEKLDTGKPVNSLVFGSTIVESGTNEAHAYLEEVVSALTSHALTDITAPVKRKGCINLKPVNGSEVKARPESQITEELSREITSTPEQRPAKETQCCLLHEEPCAENKEIQCVLPDEVPTFSIPNHNNAISGTKLTQMSDPGDHHVCDVSSKKQKKYLGRLVNKGKAVEPPLVRRTHLKDEFMERCREKVGDLLTGCRILEAFARDPIPPQGNGECSSSPQIIPSEDFKETTGAYKDQPTAKKPSDNLGRDKNNVDNKRKGKEKMKFEKEFDYERIYEELGQFTVERTQLERFQQEHLSISFGSFDLEKVLNSGTNAQMNALGSKRSRTTRSPARESGSKLLRSNSGKIQPLMYKSHKQLEGRVKKLNTCAAIGEESTNLNNKGTVPAWVRRITVNKQTADILQDLEKEEEPDMFNLSGAVKRLTVRPPHSIFKSGKHYNWLSNALSQQHSHRNKDDSVDLKRKGRNVFKGEKCDYKPLNSPVETSRGEPPLRITNDTETQERVSDKRKLDWVVVGDFCISELDKKGADPDKERIIASQTQKVKGSSKQYVRQDQFLQISENQTTDNHEGRGKGLVKDQALATCTQTVARRGVESSSFPVDSFHVVDRVTLPGPSSLVCKPEVPYKKSLEEELYKRSVVEVLLKNLLEEENRVKNNVSAEASTSYATQPSNIPMPPSPISAIAPAILQEVSHGFGSSPGVQHVTSITRPDLKLTVEIVDRQSTERSETEVSRFPKKLNEVEPLGQEAQVKCEAASASAVASTSDHSSIQNISVGLRRPSLKVQRTVGLQISNVFEERLPVILPVPIPVVIPMIQQPIQSQLYSELSRQTYAGEPSSSGQQFAAFHGKEIQTVNETSSSSPSTPSSPVSSPGREAQIEAVLTPIPSMAAHTKSSGRDLVCPLLITTKKARTRNSPPLDPSTIQHSENIMKYLDETKNELAGLSERTIQIPCNTENVDEDDQMYKSKKCQLAQFPNQSSPRYRMEGIQDLVQSIERCSLSSGRSLNIEDMEHWRCKQNVPPVINRDYIEPQRSTRVLNLEEAETLVWHGDLHKNYGDGKGAANKESINEHILVSREESPACKETRRQEDSKSLPGKELLGEREVNETGITGCLESDYGVLDTRDQRILFSKFKVRLEHGSRGNFPLLFGRRVLASKDLKILAELERKAAAVLRGKELESTSTKARICLTIAHYNWFYN